MSHDPAFLDVEDDEQRQKRIGAILTHLNTTSPHDRGSSTIPNPFVNIGRERSPGSVEPPTELLTRVRAFLPAIAVANEALAQRNPADIDIENVAESDERYIEMNLGLGVFEAKPRAEPGSRSSHSSEAESASDGNSSESESDAEASISSSDEDEDSDSSFDDDYDDSDGASRSGSSVDMRPVSSRRIKPLPRRPLSQPPKLEV